MSEKILCPAQTYRGSSLEPSEYCETEVDDYGMLCAVHDEDDRSDELYEAWLESKYDD